MRGDRTHRTLITVLALILLAAGLAVLLAGTDLFGRGFSHRHLLDNPPARFVGTHGGWVWPVAALAAAILTLLGLRWLSTVVSIEPGQRRINVSPGGTVERTVLDAGALATAVQAEVAGCPGVNDVETRIWGSPNAPRLALNVTAEPEADIAALRERLETLVLPRIRHALGRPDLPVTLDLNYHSRRSARIG